MASSTSQASQAWHHALKLRKHLTKQLEKIQADSASGVDVAKFEAVDSVLGELRLACVHTIFHDFDYAVAENTEDILWVLHTSVNAEYRRLLGRLKNTSHAVERRKVEKMHNNFLRIAQKFYKGYIQRLSACYDIPELKRAAQGIDIEQMPAEDAISPVPADLNAKVLKACHATLIRLGDLARYRVQARHKKSGYDSALTFYGLAHDLVPDSGFAFHQMGIINLDESNHLDIVYHFYRSWAVADPHPLARKNLEAEFKAKQLPDTPTARNRAAVPHDALAMWFVRLHALFYKGEISQKHEELEGEVLHRLEMAAKNVTSSDVLFKMALINMSAFHIASAKYTEHRDANTSRFCQYTLRFNVRFMFTICQVLEAELRESLKQKKEGGSDPDAAWPSQTVELLLPLLRTYTSWLAAHHHEIFQAASTLGNVVFDMVQSLAGVFTLLCAETYNQEDLSSCPYLLPEDLATRGLRPLGDDQVPEACRYHCKDDGSLKPHLQSPHERFNPRRETLARILDILRGAYYLAEDPAVPLGYKILENWLIFEYQPSQPGTVASTAKANSVPRNGGLEQQGQPLARGTPAPKKAAPGGTAAGQNVSQPTSPPSAPDMGQASGGIDHAEKTVIDMLAPFLRPPTPPQHPRSSEESSYGMHTNTANEVFAHLQGEPSPNGSAPSRKLEPLPWNWVYTPTPHKPQDPSSCGRAAFAGHHTSDRSSKGSVSGMISPEDPFATSDAHQLGQADPARQQSFGSPSAEAVHRNRLLQSFANTNANAPRYSAFSSWPLPEAIARSQQLPAASGRGAGGFENPPTSSDASGFSQLSSLYQGTPSNARNPNVARFGNGGYAPLKQPERGSASRQFQMDETTSSYDAAILNAAFSGNR